MLYWTMFQKQNIIKDLSHIEEEYCGMSESKAIFKRKLANRQANC